MDQKQPLSDSGFLMIHSIDVKNFRCFRRLRIDGCQRLNVIVGDNGSGKTALLESMFLPLAATSEVAMRLRQFRGIDGLLSGQTKNIEAALWGDYFYNNDMSQGISLILSGDGVESRSLEITKGRGEARLPLQTASPAIEESFSSAIRFIWTDSHKRIHPVTPIIDSKGLTLPNTGEELPDFFFFAANQTVGSVENAGRFSELSKANKQRQFVTTFTKEYKWITDLNVEVHAGAPVIFASIAGIPHKLPLPNVSSGINRTLAFMLAIASRPEGVVLIDEVENGLYFEHFPALWRAVLSFLREYKTQAFVSTHSKECLNGLIEAAGDDVSDISLWRMEISESARVVKQFSGDDLKAGIEYKQEVR